jgi:hypothetical protein
VIDQIEQLTTTPTDSEKIINQLSGTDTDRTVLLKSLNTPNASATGFQRLRTGAIYLGIITIATGLAALLIVMMGRH